MYTYLQCQARLTIWDPFQHSWMRSYHHHSWGWRSSSNQVCLLSALTWKLLDEHLCTFPTPGEHGAMRCVSDGANPLGRFLVMVRTATEQVQLFSNFKHPGPLHLGRYPAYNLPVASPDLSLQLTIWVLIVLWQEQYVDCAVFAQHSPAAVRLEIRSIFVEWRSETRYFCWKLALLWHPLNEYLSDRNSDSGRWKSG